MPPPKTRVPAPAPRLLSADTASVPASIVVPPKYVLAPASVSVPAPILVSPPMPDIVPENVVLVLSLPVFSVAEPSVTLPAPASEPMVWLKPSRSSVAPLATANALPAENAFAVPACRVPALTAVAPEYVLSPESLSVPAPTLVSPPKPEIVPARIAKLPLVSTVPPPNSASRPGSRKSRRDTPACRR